MTPAPLPAPQLDGRSPVRLQLHPYTIAPIVPEPGYAVPLLDRQGRALGPALPPAQFCALAARGSGVIGHATYRVVDTGPLPQTYCGAFFPRLQRRQPLAAVNLARSRFVRIAWPYGLGAYDDRLIPGHTVASGRFAAGTVLFAPALRGWPMGAEPSHDGYLVVGDDTQQPRQERLELFVGLSGAEVHPLNNWPAWLEVYVVDDSSLAASAWVRYRHPDDPH